MAFLGALAREALRSVVLGFASAIGVKDENTDELLECLGLGDRP